jgi:putative phosphoesterase
MPFDPTLPTQDPCDAIVGVLADTHIPDKVNRLHPEIIPIFQKACVSHILHAGDICAKRVLDELSQVAPVTAVRGNRDIFVHPLRPVNTLEQNGLKIALTHGHGSLWNYLLDKFWFMVQGYDLNRYLNLLHQAGKDASVVVFGHTHHTEITHDQGRLLFNPGSASFGFTPGTSPSIGLLRISAGSVSAEIVPLEGYQLVQRDWVKKYPL